MQLLPKEGKCMTLDFGQSMTLRSSVHFLCITISPQNVRSEETGGQNTLKIGVGDQGKQLEYL